MILSSAQPPPNPGTINQRPVTAEAGISEGVDLRLETLFWSEMLKHSGLEKSFTLGGGDGAQSFARFMIDEIAADLAVNRPLGIGHKVTDIYLGKGV